MVALPHKIVAVHCHPCEHHAQHHVSFSKIYAKHRMHEPSKELLFGDVLADFICRDRREKAWHGWESRVAYVPCGKLCGSDRALPKHDIEQQYDGEKPQRPGKPGNRSNQRNEHHEGDKQNVGDSHQNLRSTCCCACKHRPFRRSVHTAQITGVLAFESRNQQGEWPHGSKAARCL